MQSAKTMEQTFTEMLNRHRQGKPSSAMFNTGSNIPAPNCRVESVFSKPSLSSSSSGDSRNMTLVNTILKYIKWVTAVIVIVTIVVIIYLISRKYFATRLSLSKPLTPSNGFNALQQKYNALPVPPPPPAYCRSSEDTNHGMPQLGGSLPGKHPGHQGDGTSAKLAQHAAVERPPQSHQHASTAAAPCMHPEFTPARKIAPDTVPPPVSSTHETPAHATTFNTPPPTRQNAPPSIPEVTNQDPNFTSLKNL